MTLNATHLIEIVEGGTVEINNTGEISSPARVTGTRFDSLDSDSPPLQSHRLDADSGYQLYIGDTYVHIPESAVDRIIDLTELSEIDID